MFCMFVCAHKNGILNRLEWEAAKENFIWLTTTRRRWEILNKKYVKDCFIYSAVVHSLWTRKYCSKAQYLFKMMQQGNINWINDELMLTWAILI